MSANIKDKILEFADIAKSCPENFQERCFELLLQDFLDSRNHSQTEKKTNTVHPKTESAQSEDQGDTKEKRGVAEKATQEDFSDTDLHVKVRKFLSTQGLNIDHINGIFYKEGEKPMPLYEDLKSTKMAESQIRVALLQSLRNALSSGEFEFEGEAVRSEVQLRKCYDPPNFAAHFKNNKSLFEGFEKYDKNTKIKLSTEGRTSLANVIRALQ